jgi:hypothetical protein
MPVKTALLTLALALPLIARAADVPTTYTVNDTALKAAVAGTNLTFTLYTDASCTQQAFQQVVPIETVAFVSRLKTFTPASAPKGPKIDEVHETLTGVSAAGNLYLKVTGTGITPVGGACQAQATVLPAAAVVKDANGVLVGTAASGNYPVALRSVAGTTVGIDSLGGNVCVIFPAAGCGGQGVIAIGTPSFVLFAPAQFHGTTLYYATGSPGTPVSAGSFDCGFGCSDGGGTNIVLPTATATVPAFTPPFHVEVP